MKVSVLICTYNRPQLLEQCLSALVECTSEKPDQVVVVNGGDERSDAVMERYQGCHGIEVKLIKTVNKNLAASRNVGLPYCTGDIVAMTDDDAKVIPDWVTQMKRLHAEHPEAGAVGGLVIGADARSFVSRVADVMTFPRWDGPRFVTTLPGVNISYKRQVIEQVGPQDETLFRGEDVDYNWRAQKLGYRIVYDPGIRVMHNHRSSLRAFLNQHYMYGRAYVLVRGKWPDLYCVYPHGLHNLHDIAKCVNFFAAALYEPARNLPQLNRRMDRFFAYPVLVATEILWRCGMARQAGSRRPAIH